MRLPISRRQPDALLCSGPRSCSPRRMKRSRPRGRSIRASSRSGCCSGSATRRREAGTAGSRSTGARSSASRAIGSARATRSRAATPGRRRAAPSARRPPRSSRPPPKKAVGGPSTVGPTVTPNGVLVSLKAPDDATLDGRDRAGRRSPSRSPTWPAARRSPTSTARSRPSASPPTVPLVDGPDQEDFPAAVADGQGGALGRLRRPQAARAGRLDGARRRRPKRLRRLRPQGGRRPGPAAPLRRRQGRRADRRHRRGARRLAAGGRRRWRGARRRRLVREPRRQLGPLRAGATTRRPRRWSDAKRLTDRPRGRHRRRPGRRARRQGLDGLAGLGRRPGRHPPRPGRGRRRWRRTRQRARPANEWSPVARRRSGAAAFDVAFDTYRRRATTTSSCAPLRRRRARLAQCSSSSRARPGTRPGRAWRSTRAGGSGSPTRSGPTNWGKDAENLVDGEGSTLYRASRRRGSAASTATACSTPPTRSPRRPSRSER